MPAVGLHAIRGHRYVAQMNHEWRSAFLDGICSGGRGFNCVKLAWIGRIGAKPANVALLSGEAPITGDSRKSFSFGNLA